MNWGHFGEKMFLKKSLTMLKKLKRGPFGIFQHPFRRETPKLKGDLRGKFISEKVLQCGKNDNGDPSVSPGIVCYADKK